MCERGKKLVNLCLEGESKHDDNMEESERRKNEESPTKLPYDEERVQLWIDKLPEGINVQDEPMCTDEIGLIARTDPSIVAFGKTNVELDEYKKMCSSPEFFTEKQFITRARWTDEEKKALYKHFGKHLLRLEQPARRDIETILGTEPALKNRSLNQVVTYINNIVHRKTLADPVMLEEYAGSDLTYNERKDLHDKVQDVGTCCNDEICLVARTDPLIVAYGNELYRTLMDRYGIDRTDDTNVEFDASLNCISKEMCSSSECSSEKKFITRARWTDEEKDALYKHFGKHLLRLEQPARRDIETILETEPALKNRSLNQVVTYINNIVHRKTILPESVINNLKTLHS